MGNAEYDADILGQQGSKKSVVISFVGELTLSRGLTLRTCLVGQ